MNTQEMYDSMGKVSGKNVLKYIPITRLVVEYNMGSYHPKDNLQIKD